MSTVVAPPHSPYKGLAPFEDSEVDAVLFFGRERESEVIAANLMASRVTVLYGPSGVGKTSVLRAGVAYRLRQEQAVDVVVFSNWSGDPVASLIDEVAGEADSLVDAVEDAAARTGGDLYVIFDQFEEYFLYHPPRGPLTDALAEVLRRPGLRVNVLLGMREDALARLDALKAAIPNLLANRLRLERLDRAAGEAAIVGPIGRFNAVAAPEGRVEIETDLVSAILDEVTAGRVELGVAGRGVAAGGAEHGRIEAPYLQLVLARLWEVEAARGSKTLQLDTLRELGGAERIVESHLERAMAELSPREKGAAAAMYNFLVTPSGTKIAHGVHDLAGYAAIDEGEAAGVLQRLTAERIVRASSDNGPASTRYEIFHDVLADAVLAWRSRFEADRRIAEERRSHERRHRRLLVFGSAALIGLALMAALTVYAFAQRSNAREQAAAAQVERTRAEAEADERLIQQNRAERSEKALQRRAKQLRAALTRAERGEREETAARLDALAQKERAEGNEARANQFAAQADRARRRLRAQVITTRSERDRARRATAQSNRRLRIISARRLAESARSLLEANPAMSVRRALAAVAAFRAARTRPVPALEDTLRDGLLNLRLRAVLPGGGRVRVAHFSSDGSRILLAGAGGARIYDVAARFRVRRLLPASALADAEFSRDGRLVAGAGPRSVQIWDATSGAPVSALEQADVTTLAFSPDGRLIATGSTDGTARLWSVAGGLPLASFVHARGARGDDVRSVRFSPDGTRLLTVGGDRFARVYSVARQELQLPLNNVVLVNAARFSPDGRLIATAGADTLVRLWDPATGALRQVLPTTGQTADLAFSPNGELIASAGSLDTVARVWNVDTGRLLGILTGHRSGIETVAFSPNGRSIVTTGRVGTVRVSQAEVGFLQAELSGHRRIVRAASYSPDGQTIVTASDDGTARLWDARVDTAGPGPPGVPRRVGDHEQPVNAVDISAAGRLLSAGDDGTVHLVHRGLTTILRHGAAVNAASFSRSGRLVIGAGDDGTARIWRVADGQAVATLRHGGEIAAAAFTPNGTRALTAGRDGTLVIWRVRDGRLLHRLHHGRRVNDVSVSRDGRFAASGGDDGTVAVWRLRDGARLRVLTGHSADVVRVRFSPDAKRIATAAEDSTARIWNASTGRSERVLSGHTEALTSLAFSPSGAWLATSSIDRDARVWHVPTGREVALLRQHAGLVSDVAFSADGRWLATAGPTAVGIWRTRRSGEWPAAPVYLVRGPTRPINDLAFSKHGWRLIYGSRDGSVRTFECSLCGGISRLAAIARGRLREIARPR